MSKTPEEIAAEEVAAKAAADAENKPEATLAAAQAEIEKWKALSRKNEAQAKENADKSKKFDELEEQSKTAQEKAEARAVAAETALAERDAKDTAKTLAEEIAKAKSEGLATPIPAEALRGMTREELEAHADTLAALLPKADVAADADGQGKTGRIGDGEMSADEIVEAATAR